MNLILYDMNTLSLISTVTPGNSKAVIEHEIIFIKNGNNFWLILVYNREHFHNNTYHCILGLPTNLAIFRYGCSGCISKFSFPFSVMGQILSINNRRIKYITDNGHKFVLQVRIYS